MSEAEQLRDRLDIFYFLCRIWHFYPRNIPLLD